MTTKNFIAICTRLLIKYQLSFQRNLFSISSISQKFIAICTRLLIKYQLSFQRNLFSMSSISQKAMCGSAQNALYFLCVHWREDCRGKVCTDNLRMQKCAVSLCKERGCFGLYHQRFEE